jgi:phytoene/squalene synthetase
MTTTPDSNSPRYFAWLYSPPTQRSLLQSLYGIEREVSDSVRPGLDHHVAHSRLQWWREECERAANGNPVHPLTRELVAALNALPNEHVSEETDGTPMAPVELASRAELTTPASLAAPATPTSVAGTYRAEPVLVGLTGFVDTAIWDLAGATFETRKELTAYCERWASAMIDPLVAAATERAGARHPSWRGLGMALREIEMLTALARDARYGRLRIPIDDLERAGVDASVLAKPPWPESLTGLLRERLEQLRGDLMRSVNNVEPETQLACRGLLVWAALAWRSARSASKALPHPLPSARMGAIADAWFAWRSARKATIGRFRLD